MTPWVVAVPLWLNGVPPAEGGPIFVTGGFVQLNHGTALMDRNYNDCNLAIN